MALTFTPSTIHPVDTYGAQPIRFVTAVAAASDYAAGGYSVPAGNGIPIGTIYFVEVVGAASTGQATTYFGQWNTGTSKLQFYGGAASGVALAEVSASTDLSAYTFLLRITGINP